MDVEGKKEERNFVTVGKAAFLTGLDIQTIRKMADNSSILCYRTPSGQRRINVQSIQKLCSMSNSNKEKSNIQKKNYLYARVSTSKQLDDLSRQVEFLQRPEFSEYDVIKDIGSGINFQRKGLATILESCIHKNIGEVVIAHRDRLCRFGFELIDKLVTMAGGKITVLDNSNNKTCEQELTEDLLAIIHVFSCRQMGKRSYSNRKIKNEKDKNLSNKVSKIETE
jgi:predicted site-specific integrase-resolvase